MTRQAIGPAAKLSAVLGAAAIALGAGASAQAAPAEARFVSAADALKDAGKPIATEPGYTYLEVLRDKDGEVEVHDGWNDIMVVQEGRGEMRLGGVVAGGRVISPGEHRGGTATGARVQPLAPGDILFIPAGMAHQAMLAPGTSQLRYFTVKTKP